MWGKNLKVAVLYETFLSYDWINRAVLAHSSCSLKNKHKIEQCFGAFELVKK